MYNIIDADKVDHKYLGMLFNLCRVKGDNIHVISHPIVCRDILQESMCDANEYPGVKAFLVICTVRDLYEYLDTSRIYPVLKELGVPDDYVTIEVISKDTALVTISKGAEESYFYFSLVTMVIKYLAMSNLASIYKDIRRHIERVAYESFKLAPVIRAVIRLKELLPFMDSEGMDRYSLGYACILMYMINGDCPFPTTSQGIIEKAEYARGAV